MSWSRFIGFLLLGFVAYRLIGGGGLVGNPPPFEADKLCVLIVEETSQRGSLTPDQRAAILSTGEGSMIAVVKASGGEYRILDKDQTEFTKDAGWVGKAFAVPRESIPWIVTASPKGGVSEPLPQTTAEILKAVEAAK